MQFQNPAPICRILLSCLLPTWLLADGALASTPPTRVGSEPISPGSSLAESRPEPALSWIKRHFGITTFSFFEGPGLNPSGQGWISPNVLGLPVDDGMRLTNYISTKYKFSQSLALDFQLRVQWVPNNARSVEAFQPLRWQSPRVGISGKLASGESWNLTGAFNTDLPYFFPSPLGGGVVATYRTTLLTPGLFAGYTYKPKGSPWSLYSLVMPRFFIYENRSVAEPQLSRAGYSPTLKNEFILDLAPTLNYALSENMGLRLGTELIYSKLIHSDWNPFQGTLNGTDLSSQAWRLAPVPLQLGLTREWSDAFQLSTYIQAYPIAAQRFRRDGTQADLMETVSVGMWINGAIL